MLTGTACGDGGKVSESDYLKAVEKFTRCLTDHGVEVVNHGWDPVNHLQVSLSYAADEAAGEPNQQGMQCEDKHLTQVSIAYADQATAVMAADLRHFVRSCLADKGISIPSTVTNLGGFLASAGASGEELVYTCVTDGLAKHYPDVPPILGTR